MGVDEKELRERLLPGPTPTPALTHNAHVASREKVVKELGRLIKMTAPICLAQLVQFGVTLFGVSFVGRLGQTYLAGISLAVSMANVTGVSVMIGLSSALDTLCAQAFGAQKFHLLGEQLQRAILILSIPAFATSVLWYFMDGVLDVLGQDPKIATIATRYLRAFIPGMWLMMLFACLRRFMVNQRVTLPQLVSTIFGLAICPLLNYAFILKAKLNIEGAALAVEAIYGSMIVIAVSLYSFLYPALKQKTWQGFTRNAFAEWGPFIRLSIPACLMVVLEWWSHEALTLMSGLLPQPDVTLAAFSLQSQLLTLCFMVPLSFGFATATRVGNQIGEGNPLGARISLMIAFAVQLLFSFVTASVLLWSPLRSGWSSIFTHGESPHVDDLCYASMPLVVIVQIVDGTNQVFCGAIRGTGQQFFGSISAGVAYIFVALPLAAVLAFEWGQSYAPGLYGLFAGLIAGCFVQTLLNGLLVFMSDWGKIACAAQDTWLQGQEGDDEYMISLRERLARSLTLNSSSPVETLSSSSRWESESISFREHARSVEEVPYALIQSLSSNAGPFLTATSSASREMMVKDEWERLAAENEIERRFRSSHSGRSL